MEAAAPPARRGRPPKISAARILDVARARPDTSWTLAELAAELGVTEPALYYYFPNKQAVLRALGDAVVAELTLPVCEDDWQQWLRAVAVELFELGIRNQGLSGADSSNLIGSGPANLRLGDELLATLTRCGFELEEAGIASSLVVNVAVTYARLIPTADADVRVELLALAEAEGVDHVAELYRRETSFDVRGQFEAALDIVIQGVAATRMRSAKTVATAPATGAAPKAKPTSKRSIS